jgi:stearoyl-CoA desaturase (delta-9 desaturase)
VFQAILGMLVAAAGQRGPLWWSYTHRAHHRHSETAKDLHSPLRHGFWHAHLGWILERGNCDTDLDAVRDLSGFPELVWINKYHYLFAYGLMTAIFLLGQYTSAFGAPGHGVAATVWVFFLGTLASLHATFAINTVTHGRRPGWFHRRRFATSDASTNCWLLCIPTMGSSWHNNHHRYMNAARAGFYWWELDLAYECIRLLALLRIVWNVREVPAEILAEGRGPT